MITSQKGEGIFGFIFFLIIVVLITAYCSEPDRIETKNQKVTDPNEIVIKDKKFSIRSSGMSKEHACESADEDASNECPNRKAQRITAGEAEWFGDPFFGEPRWECVAKYKCIHSP